MVVCYSTAEYLTLLLRQHKEASTLWEYMFPSGSSSTHSSPPPKIASRNGHNLTSTVANLSKDHRATHRISLSAIRHNYAMMESSANRQRCNVIVVVKADGYGHGPLRWRYSWRIIVELMRLRSPPWRKVLRCVRHLWQPFGWGMTMVIHWECFILALLKGDVNAEATNLMIMWLPLELSKSRNTSPNTQSNCQNRNLFGGLIAYLGMFFGNTSQIRSTMRLTEWA